MSENLNPEIDSETHQYLEQTAQKLLEKQRQRHLSELATEAEKQHTEKQQWKLW
jgi:hypothetical protein